MKLALVAFAAAASASGCATVIAGGPDEVPIVTNPPGAYVYLDGQVIGQTPLVVSLDRKRHLGDIRIYYPGFHPVQVKRYKHFNAWTLGNFFLAVFPVIVDLITGDYQAFDDEPISLGLTPGQAPAPYGMQPQLPQQLVPQQPRPLQPVH